MKGKKETKEVTLSSLSPKIIKNYSKTVQKFPKTLVKWRLTLFLKMFRVSASATFLGKLFHSLTIFAQKEYLKLFSFAGNGLSLWRWLVLNGRKSCANVKYSNG